MANFVEPIVSDEGEYLGSSLEQRSEGLWRHNDQTADFIQNDVTGETRHIMEGVELQDPEGFAGFDEAAYVEDVLNLYGGRQAFNEAAAWAAENLPQVDLERFNALLDTGELSDVSQALEFLAAKVQEANPDQPAESTDEEPSDEAEEWFSENEAYVEDTLQGLLEAEYTQEQVEIMQDVAEQFQADSTEHTLLQVGQMVAAGELTMDSAIKAVIHQYGQAEAARAYLHLQQLLN